MKTKKTMKNLLFAFLGLLFIASCKKKDTPVPAKKVISIAVTPSSPHVAVRLTQQLTVAIEPSDAEKKEVTWSSSDPSKAVVDASGLVTGIEKGTAVITAATTDGSNIKETVTVHVMVNAAAIAITPFNPSVGVGGNLAFVAAVLPADAAQAVTWTSSDPNIAVIDPVTGVATGKTIGTVTIKAAAAVAGGTDVSHQTTLTVKSHEASIAITLGEENFAVETPAAGYYTSVANAPRTVISDITKVKVNVTPAAHASVKIGSRVFISGYPLDFTSPVTFTVTAQDGTAKNYTLAIAAYNATANPYGIYTVKHLIDMAGNDVNNRGG